MDDALLKAKERQIFQRVLTSEPGGGVEECHMVGYGNGRYRAHAIGPDGKEIHVTDLKSFDEAKRLLREWAVTNDLFYGGGYLYFENENLYRLFCEARREPEAEKLP
jgi:hypothetical protein